MLTITVEHRVHPAPPRATPRVLEVAGMFGLGIDQQREVTIIPRTTFNLPIPGPGIVLITGPSGSGKSTLLRLIAEECKQRGVRVLRPGENATGSKAMQDFGVNPSLATTNAKTEPSLGWISAKILHTATDDMASGLRDIVLNSSDVPTDAATDAAVVDLIAPDRPLANALHVLSFAGLGDAFVMLRRPDELSDGQRFRFDLACVMALADESQQAVNVSQRKNAPECVIIVDEFAATLDRLTAVTLARSLRRWIDRTACTLIARHHAR